MLPEVLPLQLPLLTVRAAEQLRATSKSLHTSLADLEREGGTQAYQLNRLPYPRLPLSPSFADVLPIILLSGMIKSFPIGVFLRLLKVSNQLRDILLKDDTFASDLHVEMQRLGVSFAHGFQVALEGPPRCHECLSLDPHFEIQTTYSHRFPALCPKRFVCKRCNNIGFRSVMTYAMIEPKLWNSLPQEVLENRWAIVRDETLAALASRRVNLLWRRDRMDPAARNLPNLRWRADVEAAIRTVERQGL